VEEHGLSVYVNRRAGWHSRGTAVGHGRSRLLTLLLRGRKRVVQGVHDRLPRADRAVDQQHAVDAVSPNTVHLSIRMQSRMGLECFLPLADRNG
jgi:hypothetical protein